MIAAQKIGYEHRGEVIQLFPKKERNLECSEYTASGRRKASAAEPLRSLDDIRTVQQFFLNANRIRDYALFTTGICTGLRVSDLCRLLIRDVLNEDGSFKDYIYMIEKKTGKYSSNQDDKCLITDAIREALTGYLSGRKYELDDPLFYSKKSGKDGHFLDPKSGWRILAEAGDKCELGYHISSHSMRKTFANIAACVGGETSIDMSRLLSVQHMLKHSDYKTTMRYLRLSSIFTEQARKDVSDFVMGKTEYNDLRSALMDDKQDKMDKILEAIERLSSLMEEGY